MGGVVDGVGSVFDDHAVAAAEFLMGSAAAAAVPHADGDSRSVQRIRAKPQEIGTRCDRGIGIVGGEIDGEVAFEADDFLNGSVRSLDPQGQSDFQGAAACFFPAGVFDGGDGFDRAGAGGRVGKVPGSFEDVGDAGCFPGWGWGQRPGGGGLIPRACRSVRVLNGDEHFRRRMAGEIAGCFAGAGG